MKRLLLSLTMLSMSALSIAQSLTAGDYYYHQAFEELMQMIDGRQPINFKRAVFVTENAYVDNVMSYEDFCFQINALTKLTKAIAETDGLNYSKSDRNQVLMAGSIYRVMKDSLVFQSPDKKVSFRNVPFTYDLEDFWGEKDWTKMFVTKLLYEQTGNCHSLPALYKIIADELKVKAWLAITPNHTYIKQWSDDAGWYNTELTTGRFPYDSDIKLNSYITMEAIVDGIYMDTLSARQNIAYVMTDLAQGYVKKFDYESNVVNIAIEWLDTALVYYPSYPNAMILRAELLKKDYQRSMQLNGGTDLRSFKDSKMKNQFDELEKAYYAIHAKGYRRMPKEMYLNWLFRANKDTTRLPYKFKTPQPFKQYGYKVLTVTSGSGENSEFFDQEKVVRIGTVELDRTTGRIVKFTELADDDLPDEVISRSYDPAIGRWWQIDPLAQNRFAVNPYNFVQNNPVNRVDPSGLTDFALNKGTGAVTQVGAANDDPDRVVKTDKDGNVKRKGDGFLGFLVRESKRGDAKTAVGGIEKGILRDGQNFQTGHTTIGVNGEGQPSLAGVRDFALKLSNYVGKEVGGHYLSNNGSNTTDHVAFGPYQNNDAQNERSGLVLDRGLLGNVRVTADWHTHLSRFGDSDRLVPSGLSLPGGDVQYKRNNAPNNPSLRFLIITNPSANDQTATEIEY